jgi:hypothetical protein
MSKSMRVGRPSSERSNNRGWGSWKNRGTTHAKQIAPESALRSSDAARQAVPIPAMGNGRCRMHGGKSPGAPIGNTNARKHGRYSVEAVAKRRELAALIRSMRRLVEEVE